MNGRLLAPDRPQVARKTGCVVTPYVEQETWARVVFGVSIAAFTLGELSRSFRSHPEGTHSNIWAETVFRLIFYPAILMLPLARALAPTAVIAGVTVFVIGLSIGWLGLLLRWWAFVTLGRYFTSVVQTAANQVVIEGGPYRVLRHPSYTGLLAAFLGCGLMLGNWVGVIANFVLTLVALAYRLRREEQVMVDTFGQAYADFAKGRARLLPFVW
jgi:protein-S-isoprenylcysteine O-methyltransferase Ste14